ncbi:MULTISPECIES: hypothetical protein [unclassified Novosphingobium]|uniref:hypothetical protein n=1 Tax=unclassified Novosphingobium TaxID=2644732 RepID=UPI001357EC25|nr:MULTISPECIES: hypothetical protein [unclassified Novosphingobium]
MMRPISWINNFLIGLLTCVGIMGSEATYAHGCPSEKDLSSVHYMNSRELRDLFSNVRLDSVLDGAIPSALWGEMFFSSGEHQVVHEGYIDLGRFKIENDALVTSGHSEKLNRAVKVFTLKGLMYFREIGPTSICRRVNVIPL